MQVFKEEICRDEFATIYRYTVLPEPLETRKAKEVLNIAIEEYRNEGKSHNIYYEEMNPYDTLIVEYSIK